MRQCCRFELQGTFPRACHVLASQGPKDKWRKGIRYGYIRIIIQIIIRRDGSGIVVPIRIRTES